MERQQLIRVTTDDVAAATRRDSHTCAVATAIARTLPDAHHISVDMQFVKFTEGTERYSFATPGPVQSYIIDFDAGDEVGPFNFRLDKRNRMIVQRYLLTPEGKQKDAARKKVADRVAKVERLRADPDVSVAEVRRAQRKVRDAKTELDAVAAVISDKPRGKVDQAPKLPTTAESGDGVVHRSRAASRKGPSKVRAYGGRTMRINQDRATRTGAAIAAEAALGLSAMPPGGYAT